MFALFVGRRTDCAGGDHSRRSGPCFNPAGRSPLDTSTPAGVDDIIVTAQRRAERFENVPVSITAVTAATIQFSGVKRLDEVQQIAAGVQIKKGYSFTQPSVRGISTLTLGYGFEDNVAVYVDGLYQNDMVAINQDPGTV